MGTVGQRENLRFRQPVKVLCARNQDDQFSATALGLGLLREATEQKDAWDAQLTLSDYIAEEYMDLKSTNPSTLGTFAKKVWSNIRDVIVQATAADSDRREI